MSFEVIPSATGLIKAWTRGVPVEDSAAAQLRNVASLPIVHGWVAVMPDVHWGIGATVGSVVPTLGAIIPAAVGVDIGCGMMAARTDLVASDLPDGLGPLRHDIERSVPHGRSHDGKPGRDQGAWRDAPDLVRRRWGQLEAEYVAICDKTPRLGKGNDLNHLGTLGTGNHFIEVCLDQDDRVWVMLHSGSRGVGNRIGTTFIDRAKREMAAIDTALPDENLAWFAEGTESFDDYVGAVGWAQNYARCNRELMMEAVLRAISHRVRPIHVDEAVVNCHHNYVAREHHFGADVWVTRKGAVRAGKGEFGIIPGSMGARSYIVCGKGNKDAYESCSHGSGRAMSRTAARKRFTVEDHARMTAGIECRKDSGVIDETPAAYKDIDAVMAAQTDLVDVVHTLRQVLCVKG